MLTFVLLTASITVSAAPRLDDPDPAERVRAVEIWSRTHPAVKLPGTTDERLKCVRVSAPQELQCDKQVWLCRPWIHQEGPGLSARSDHAQLLETPNTPTAAQIWHPDMGLFRYESRPILFTQIRNTQELDCASMELPSISESFAGYEEYRAARIKECEDEARRTERQSRVELRCEILLVNPCRQELFMRCSGRNTRTYFAKKREQVPVLDEVFRRTWTGGARPPAGGGPRHHRRR